MVGAFWEGGDPEFQLQASATDTLWGASVRLTGWALTPGIHWEHSRKDGSGTVIAGASWSPLSHITLDLGIPWLYGVGTSEYVVNDTDPHKQRFEVGLRISLDVNF